MTAWVPIVVAFISLAGVVIVPLVTSRRTQRLNQAQMDELEQKRKLADDDRNEKLRQRWQATTDDVDYLWSFFQDEVTPWMRQAYEIIAPTRPEFPKPPVLKERPKPVNGGGQ